MLNEQSINRYRTCHLPCKKLDVKNALSISQLLLQSVDISYPKFLFSFFPPMKLIFIVVTIYDCRNVTLVIREMEMTLIPIVQEEKKTFDQMQIIIESLSSI
jgi:hypothetical protein